MVSKSMYKIAGIFTLVTSIFFILGGIFIPGEGGNVFFVLTSPVFGIILLAIGTVLYKIIKVEE